MEVVLQHFSHEHPLLLTNDVDAKHQVCYGCQDPITDSVSYSCEHCNYYLHKKCAELPHGVKHPKHKHPLTLLPHPPRTYFGRWECDICEKSQPKGFIYTCAECRFDVHVSCTPLEKHDADKDIHDHPVTYMRRKATFFCDACGTEGEDFSYRCTSTSCEFWIHEKCACSTNIIKRNDHDHDLQLAHSIPYSLHKFDFSCYICDKKIHPNYWVYYCSSCKYFSHLKCGTSEENLTLSDEYPDVDLVHVPVTGLLDMMSKFSIDTPFTYNGDRIACPNYHCGSSWIDNDIDSNKGTTKNKETILCDVCVQPINFSSSFSNCGDCHSSIAHTKCTFLQKEILHPSHQEHPLTLCNSSSNFQLCICDICGGYTSGFFFSCQTCNNFQIDMCCATHSLPSIIKHEAHKHPLTLQNITSTNSYPEACKACSNAIDAGMEYVCNQRTCTYHVHTNCAMLPGKLEHDWDKHLMSLTYPPFNHPEDNFCETCEDDIDPRNWLYHCSKCDHSFHTNCVHLHDDWKNFKFGTTYKFEHHEHNLTFIRKPKKLQACEICGYWSPNSPFLNCEFCVYQLCFDCGGQLNGKII